MGLFHRHDNHHHHGNFSSSIKQKIPSHATHSDSCSHEQTDLDTRLRNIRIAFFLNIGFALIELIGGIFSSSLAVISDAIHDLGDAIALGFAYWSESLQKVDKKYSLGKGLSYGYVRMSLLSAGITSLLLMFASIYIIYEAIQRFLVPIQPHTPTMLGLAILGILVNGFAAFKIGSGKTLNEKAISWHLLEDVLGWIAVLISAVAMSIWNIPWMDAAISIVFSIFILNGVFVNLKDAFHLFLQGTPRSVDVAKLKGDILEIEGVESIHDLHLWSLDGEKHILTLHVVVSAKLDWHQCGILREKLRAYLRSQGNFHCTIELEAREDVCRDSC